MGRARRFIIDQAVGNAGRRGYLGARRELARGKVRRTKDKLPVMSRLLAGLLVLALASVLPVRDISAQESHIAAVVNGDIVTSEDLAGRLALMMRSSDIPDTPENEQRLAPRILRQMIDEKLQMQDAAKLNIAVSDQEINDALAGLEQRNNLPKGGLDQYLKQSGIPRATLISQITASIAWGKVVRYQLSNEVSVSNEEIDQMMDSIKNDAGKPQSHVAEIFLAVDNPSQDDEIQRLADRLIAQIRQGANFSAVAQQFSQSPSAAAGGDIGWLTPTQLGSPLGDAVEKMKPGEMSYPIRTPAGYYILYIVDRRIPGATNVEDTKLSLTQVLFAYPPGASAADRQRIQNESAQASATVKSCGELAKIGNSHVPPFPVKSAENVRAGDLNPPDLRAQLLQMKVTEATKPMPSPVGPIVIMMCARQDPQGGLPSRDQIEDTLARQRLEALARRYMSNLRRAAYIDIRG
jgi:peptidyl-prolyl cis-trans isomerase SurA